MNELTIGDKVYISSKRAAEITGYAKDYVGQLCREGRVEATLVGRNWYVLESSIRAHRFGESAEVRAEQAPEPESVPTWEPPKYSSEELPSIPTLERKSLNLLDQDDKGTSPETLEVEQVAAEPVATTVEDMQTAWREWFATRQTQRVEDETSVSAISADENPVYEQAEEEELEPVSLTRVEERIAEEEEVRPYDPVPFTREIEEEVRVNRVAPDPVTPTSAPKLRIVGDTPRASAPVRSSERVSMPRRGRVGKSGLAIKTALIAVATFAVLIAFIGSGMADAYVSNTGFESMFIRFFAGASIIE